MKWVRGLLALALALAAAVLAGSCLAEEFDIVEDIPLRSVRIRAVGDLMMHDKQLRIAKQSDGSYDFHEQYALVAESLADADYTIANLETTVGKYKGQPYSGYPRFNAPEVYLDTVRDCGVDFLTLANTHMLDRYGDGMKKTVELVDQYGFDHGGANRSRKEQDKPIVVDVNGIRLGMLCYTEMTNGMEAYCDSFVKDYGINYLRKADFAKDAARLRAAGADVVIAMPHWGTEYNRRPDESVKALAKKMVAAGIDIILGSHPHVVQPIELIETTDADGQPRVGLVAYSLGNFISNMTKTYTNSGIILDFTLCEKSSGDGYNIIDIGVVPLYCWNRDGMIQTVPSSKYDLQPPEGMGKNAAARMRETCRDLRALLDDRIPFLLQ